MTRKRLIDLSGKSPTQVAISSGAGVLLSSQVVVVSRIGGAPLKSKTPAE